MSLAPTRPAWPAPLALLLGPDASELLGVALDGYGGRLAALRVVTVGVQPGGATVVQYAADVQRADGTTTRETLAATTGSHIPHGAAVLSGHGVQVGVWRWPQDPALPALATATHPDRLVAALRALGIRREAPPSVTVRAYRPGRRAVLELTGGGPRLFLKIVWPDAVPGLRERHDLLAPHVPVPRPLAATPDGMLVLPEAAGTPVRSLLSRGAPPPPPAALESVLDALPPTLLQLPSRRTHLHRVRHFADVLTHTAIDADDERAALDALTSRLARVDGGGCREVPVHGDFYENQLLASGERVTGLLDVDTAGRGHRVDEWATLLAHLSVLALHGSPGARGYGAELLAHAERRLARDLLRPRIAAAVLGLATGPFRVQQERWSEHTRARLHLAATWARG
ncbi:aminoglycoside phosphotransferase family protein [Pseudonocardia sichuanensis]